ncbi:SusC/RagA family TonB-linked outer membrane protein [Nonlabens ulvanivorans]|uniref:SusC/RagA family TonB-linked outer membrane protein n=1 Tax=Nonlabens ulvanivorans TaxID=906888 RepID=UPI002942E41F|nr:SusC/RagA family TonB-linked outer membrane protein [Nonlabens ulvanivorans]WOI21711.1 SusC/RagA family TonB-linked outer membrane protein [Nonlabens ulvanivorans]
MKTKLNGILTLFLALVVQFAIAQTVTGKVTDASGEAVLGATVLVKGSSNATTTDFDGNYSINAKSTDILVISFAGYTPAEFLVGTQSVLNVILEESLEVVVIEGYRTVSKKTSNVAANTITSEQIENRPNASFIQRIQGQIPGLNIQTATGQPGGNSLVQLRGPSSINGNTEPLFIIDGVPVDEDNFRSLNPNDIDTFTTLKDAAATAVFGNRGANGVIVITTKSGSYNSPLEISYSSSVGFSQILDNDYNLYNSQDYLRLEQRRGTGLGNTLTDAEINAFNVNTDWSDTFYRTGVVNNQNLSFRQGGKNLSSFTSLSYTEQEGTLVASKLQRFTLRSNISGKSDNGKFRYNTRFTTGYSQNETPGSLGSGSVFFNYAFGAFNALPYLDPADYDPAALTGINAFNIQASPFVLMDNIRFAGSKVDEVKIVGGADFSYDIAKNLTANYAVGLDYTQTNSVSYEDPRAALSRVRATLDARTVDGNQSEAFSRDARFNSRANLNYVNNFGENKEHTVTAAAYVEYVKAHLKSFNYRAEGLDPRTFSPGDGSSYIGDNANDDFFVPTVGSGKNEVGLFSYFAQADYDYNKKYGVSATLRRDSSSRFTDENKWGTFWSAAVRWNLDQEDFLAESDINTLKLRASYGSIGNDRITGGYYGSLSNTRTLFATGQGYSDNQTFVLGSLGDTSLRWETIKTANIGIEYGVWGSRLRGTLDFYIKRTEDLFINRNVSAITSTFANPANLGDLENKGVELSATYDVIKAKKQGDFNATVFANVAYNVNEITSLSVPDGIIDNGNTAIAEGQSLNEYFVIPYVGVNPANGNALFRDINGDITENPTDDDRRYTGTDATPDAQGGFGFSLSYKNFFFENQWSFATGIDRFDFDLAGYLDPQDVGITQLSSDLERAWTPTNRITDVPSLDATNLNVPNNDRFLQEADFLRLRFVQLGYSLPKIATDAIGMNSARVYVSAENLLTFSKWRGNDPERPDGATQYDFPTPKIFNLGLDISF